jgi:hypothetical protein
MDKYIQILIRQNGYQYAVGKKGKLNEYQYPKYKNSIQPWFKIPRQIQIQFKNNECQIIFKYQIQIPNNCQIRNTNLLAIIINVNNAEIGLPNLYFKSSSALSCQVIVSNSKIPGYIVPIDMPEYGTKMPLDR